jgi:hypothetical protein
MPSRVQNKAASWASWRAVSLACLAIWAGIWILFLGLRVSPLDIRVIPGMAQILLLCLVVSFLAPVIASGLAVVALIRQPRAGLNWLVLGGAVAVVTAQCLVFLVSRWL